MSDIATTATPADFTQVPTAPAKGGLPVAGIMGQARAFMAQPAVVRALPAIGLVAMAGIGALIWSIFSAAPQRSLYAGSTDEEKSAMVDALQGGNIPYSIDRSSGAITVSEDDYYKARMMLASKGLPRGGDTGEDMLTNLPLGSSRAVEGERLRGAREADLARTIEGIDVVQAARVHLATDSQSIFIRDDTAPAASVMLTLQPGRTLGDSQVQAIVHLVASSVPNLSPDNVSVVDQNGRLLSRDGNNGLNAESERQIAVQTAIEERYRQAIVTMLTPIVGEGNFTAEVHADVDFSEVQSTREGFPQNPGVITSEQGQVSVDNSAAPNEGGVPGALSNQPPAAATASTTPPGAPGAATTPPVAAPAAGRRNENYNREFAVGREVSVTRQGSPTVRRVTVAVALKTPTGGKARSNAEVQAIDTLIKGAVGFDQTRGDVVALSARNFAPVTTTTPTWYEAPWVSLLARNLTAVLLAALAIFGLARPIMKRMAASAAARAEAAQQAPRPTDTVREEIAQQIVDQAIADPNTKVTIDMIEATPNYETRAALIRNFVKQDPARAALVVRDLLRADAGGSDRNG